MVLVMFFTISLEQRDYMSRLFMDIDVFGYVPEDPVKGIEVLTEVFRRLRFNYLNHRYWRTTLGKIGYFIDELSRGKIYLATVPEDTYSYEDCAKSWSSDRCKPVYIFIDVGSPFRHIILVEEWIYEDPRSKSYLITGLGFDSEYYNLRVTFRRADWILWNCTTSFCTEECTETVEKLASDKEIHFMVYPRADDETKRMFEDIMNAVVSTKPK
jgi:hypothetical protein